MVVLIGIIKMKKEGQDASILLIKYIPKIQIQTIFPKHFAVNAQYFAVTGKIPSSKC